MWELELGCLGGKAASVCFPSCKTSGLDYVFSVLHTFKLLSLYFKFRRQASWYFKETLNE